MRTTVHLDPTLTTLPTRALARTRVRVRVLPLSSLSLFREVEVVQVGQVAGFSVRPPCGPRVPGVHLVFHVQRGCICNPVASRARPRDIEGVLSTPEAIAALEEQLDELVVWRKQTADARELALICREITHTHVALADLRAKLPADDEALDRLTPLELEARIKATMAELKKLRAKLPHLQVVK